MYIPRFAYNDQGEILYIKQGCSVAGTWKIPEIFTYETEKRDFSLAGIWVEYSPLSNASEVNTKVNNMNGENNKYGFIANTIATNANNEISYKTMIENNVGVGVPDDPQLTDITNLNRTILKIINTNKLEPIKGTAYYDTTIEKIKIEVTYNKNVITKILNSKGEILSESLLTANSGSEIIGNKVYKYIIIDNLGNQKEVKTEVSGLDIYIIENETDLKFFRDAVNKKKTTATTKAYQTADIAMNEGKYTINEDSGNITFLSDAEQWVPIGSNANWQFQGKYYGQGHTISGIYINNESTNQGLFGIISANAIVRDLGITKSSIKVNAGAGGIAGNNAGTITCCYNEGSINGASANIGGIVGINGGIVTYCYNAGKVTGKNNVAGIVARASKGTVTNCYNIGNVEGNEYVGGIVGDNDNKDAQINCCYNTGYITGKNYIGGIVGRDVGTTKNSYNVGDITGSYAGGIVGSNNTSGTLTNCYNIGNITGSYIGGIAGRTTDSITSCYNTGSVTGFCSGGIVGQALTYTITIKNCNNMGMLDTSRSYVGIIIGETKYNNAVNCYIEQCYYLTGTATSVVGKGGIGSSSCYSRSTVESIPKLSWQTDNDKLNLINGGDAFVEDTNNINNGYPILKWQVETT